MNLAFPLALLVAAAPSPPEILARARAAQGGAAWDGLRTLRLNGRLSTGGLEGPFESVTDVRTGRFRDTYRLGPIQGANGFDGKEAWSQDGSGQARVDGGETPRRGAFSEAYRRAQAWWFPDRAAGEVRVLGPRSDGGRSFQALAVEPAGGRPFELWIDESTGLFDRFVEAVSGDTFTTFLADWRDVGGVQVPFSARTTRAGGEARHDQVLTVTKAERDVLADDAVFTLPAPPPPDSGFAAGRRETTIPFELLNGHIYADVKLNGKGPFRVLVDTGGVNVVTPALAKELGLESKGALPGTGVGEKTEDVGVTEVARVELGDAFVEKQAFFVFALDAMTPVEGTPARGLVGYEVFRRFVARIDYEHGQLALIDRAAFRYRGTGAVLPFVFESHIPQVEGSIDGIPGKFDLDTGSRASLDLFSPFVKEHRLVERYGAKMERIGGWGVGGPSRQRPVRAKALVLGPVEIPAPVVGLSTSTRGAFARTGIAGNVGSGVLSRFTVTFDYARQEVILEKNARFDRHDPVDRSGLWLHAAKGGFEVIEVVPGTPAAQAGLQAGDRIVSVDGKPAAAIPLHEIRARLKEAPAGTPVKLRVRSGKARRTVQLVLRDLV